MAAVKTTKTKPERKTKKVSGATRPKSTKARSTNSSSYPNRLFRSETDKVIGGVAGGLALYFNLDSTLIRLIFVLLLVFGGSGFLIYIILWIIMPSQGKIGDDIEKNIRVNSEEIKQKAENFVEDVREGQNSRQILGLFILGFGIMLLLQNFGYVNVFNLSKLWPLILIVLGIAILTRHGKN